MKIAHFSVEGMEFYGAVEGDRVRAIQGSIFSDFSITGLSFPLASITLLPPTRPTHFWGIGENYPYHIRFRIEQFGEEIATRAKRFTPWHKGASAVVASGQPVIMPVNAEIFEYEGELCIVIGKPARNVSIEDAPDYILGYTVSNDISSEGSWHSDFSHWRRKGCDTFGPVGPWIDTEVEPHNLDIITRVNGVVEDQGNTRDMVHNCYQIVSNISRYVTLHPGDLITTGAPGLTRPMKPGEVVEIEIPEIGVLRNEIVLDTR